MKTLTLLIVLLVASVAIAATIYVGCGPEVQIGEELFYCKACWEASEISQVQHSLAQTLTEGEHVCKICGKRYLVWKKVVFVAP